MCVCTCLCVFPLLIAVIIMNTITGKRKPKAGCLRLCADCRLLIYFCCCFIGTTNRVILSCDNDKCNALLLCIHLTHLTFQKSEEHNVFDCLDKKLWVAQYWPFIFIQGNVMFTVNSIKNNRKTIFDCLKEIVIRLTLNCNKGKFWFIHIYTYIKYKR